jgi:hypothetical protein
MVRAVGTESTMTTKHVTEAGLEALARAKAADDLIWSSPNRSGRHLRRRNQSVAEAVEADISMEQIADELGVLIGDVERMIASTDPHDAVSPGGGL